MGHIHFVKSTCDIGDPPSRAPILPSTGPLPQITDIGPLLISHHSSTSLILMFLLTLERIFISSLYFPWNRICQNSWRQYLSCPYGVNPINQTLFSFILVRFPITASAQTLFSTMNTFPVSFPPLPYTLHFSVGFFNIEAVDSGSCRR